MKTETKAEIEYRQQIEALTKAFTRGDLDAVAPHLADGMKIEYVEMFFEGNFEKRDDKLEKQMELVDEGFDNFKEIIAAYTSATQLAAEATAMIDGEAMLDWMEENYPNITDQQKDRIAVQRARHRVEAIARKKRIKHIQFQEITSLGEYFQDQFEHNQNIMIHLNPIHTWATLNTNELLEEDEDPPQDVLVYAHGSDTHTANFEEPGKRFIELLAEIGPCSFEELKFHMLEIEHDDLLEFCRDLSNLGLIAFA